MSVSEKVEHYIAKHPKWSATLHELRAILNSTELTEAVKWGAPAYLLDKKILVGLGAFKNHMGIWFHQGVFLKYAANKLMNAQEEKTKAMRQWRFVEGDVVDKKLVLQYLEETIANCKAGKEIKPVRAKKTLPLPEMLQVTFTKNSDFKKAFDTLTPGKQREYVEHIATAKREATQHSRLEKIIPMVKEGKGLHDKYKNC